MKPKMMTSEVRFHWVMMSGERPTHSTHLTVIYDSELFLWHIYVETNNGIALSSKLNALDVAIDEIHDALSKVSNDGMPCDAIEFVYYHLNKVTTIARTVSSTFTTMLTGD